MKSGVAGRGGFLKRLVRLRAVLLLGVPAALALAAVPASSIVGTPTVTGVSPSSGPIAGGTTVTITGTNFTGVTGADFGGTAVSAVFVSDTQVTVTSPAHAAGTVDVHVTTAQGTSPSNAPQDQFTFFALPVVQAVTPSMGPAPGGSAGGPWAITGQHFLGATSVRFGSSVAALGYAVSDTQITVFNLPAYTAGDTLPVDVVVTTPGGSSATSAFDKFTYTFAVPAVTLVNPNAGPTAGGSTGIAITGSGFVGTTAVKFGTTDATAFTVNGDTSITATSPAHAAGVVDVSVTNPGGTSAVSTAGCATSGTPCDQFRFALVPTVTSLTLTRGPAAGGTVITATGTNFFGGTAGCDIIANGVKFGSVAGTGMTACTNTTVQITSPPEAAGQVDVTVTTAGGTSATGSGDHYTFVAAPTVTGLSVSRGPTAGGTVVTVSGTGFFGGTGACNIVPGGVTFGATAGTGLTACSDTSVQITSPAESVGTVDVTVTTDGGTSATSNADKFQYVALPTVTSLSVSRGPTSGGTVVTVNGTGFFGGTTGCDIATSGVKFGTTAGTSITACMDTSVQITSPAEAAGQVDVTVTTTIGMSATGPNDKFTFVTAPTVTSVTPNSGPTGGTAGVVLTGTGFDGGTISCNISSVTFGGVAGGGMAACSDTSVTINAPSHVAGQVDVQVTTDGGTSPANDSGCAGSTTPCTHFTYVQSRPVVTAVRPKAGPVAGGTVVTITGSNFFGASSVSFGASPLTCPSASCTVNSDTQITATSPAHAAGVVDVTVTAAGLTSTTSSSDQFSYAAAPTVTVVAPVRGPAAGGNQVVITGSGFFAGTASSDVTAVTFGTTAVGGGNYTVDSDTQITVTSAPAHAAGLVDVTVSTDVGTSATSAADQYTYVAAPTVTAVAPARGPAAGGNQVVITGTGFFGGTLASDVSAVRFGTTAVGGSNYTVDSDTQITVTSAPAHTAGLVDVTVGTTSGGTSATSSTDHYTYVAAPTVTGVAPPKGPAGGGNQVIITGTGFFGGTGASDVVSVNFGTAVVAGGDYVVNSDTQITVTFAPAHVPGMVDVSVITSGGRSATSSGDHYTYTRSPGQQLMLSNTDGRLEAFGLGANRQIEHAWQGTPNGAWGSWYSLGDPASGRFISDPAAGRNADGRIEAFSVSDDGNLYHAWQGSAGGLWTAFYSLGHPSAGPLTGVPAIATNTDGRLEIFSVGADGAVWHIWQTSAGSGWGNWYSLGTPGGGRFVGNVAAGRNGDGRLEIATVDASGTMWHSWQWTPSGGWSSFYSLGHPAGGTVVGTPGEGTNGDGRLEIFVHGSDGTVWHIWQFVPSGGWGSFYSLGGDDVGDPNVARNGDGRLETFFMTSAGQVSHTWQTTPGGGWIGPFALSSNGTVLSGTPQVGTNLDGRLEVLALNQDQTMQDTHQNVPSGGWVIWSTISGTTFLPY